MSNTVKKQYICPKCGCQQFTADTIQTTGSNLSRILDIQNKKFTAVICDNCGYTELYKAQSTSGMDILDFLIG